MAETLEHTNEKEYASKGVAGTGLGLGIAGTALSLLNGNGNGLGGILGGAGNSQQLADAKAEIARLTSEKYTDKVILEERDRHLGWVERLASNEARIENLVDVVEKNEARNAANISSMKEFLL